MVIFPTAAAERLGMMEMKKTELKKREHIITFPTFEHC